MFRASLLICSATLILSSAYAVSQPLVHWQQEKYIETSFIQIALKSEHGKSDMRLHKWRQPILYHIHDRTDDKALHKKMVRQQLKHLSHITGHKIMPAENDKKPNLTVIFSSERELATDLTRFMGLKDDDFRLSIVRNSICVAHLSYDSAADIKNAVVVIPVDRARAEAKLMACVVEELTQIMGLPNDSAEVYPSIFNDHSHNDFLTGLDYIFLKLLYHPSLSSGMTEASLNEHIPRLLQRLDYKKWLKDAEKRVRENSLENWLD